MPIVEFFTWPCPVDEHKVGALILTEDRLSFSLRSDPAEMMALPDAADEARIAAALPKGAITLPAAEVQRLRMLAGRAHFKIDGSGGAVVVAFRKGSEKAADDVFSSLARALDLGEVEEREAPRMISLASPVLALAFVLMAGLFLLVLAEQDEIPAGSGASPVLTVPSRFAHGLGMVPVGLATAVGVAGSLGWLVFRLRHPVRLVTAGRPPVDREPDRPAVDLEEDAVRSATAELLGLDPSALTSGTRFVEDLSVPPGVLLETIEDLEERFGVVAGKRSVHTFADLLAALRG